MKEEKTPRGEERRDGFRQGRKGHGISFRKDHGTIPRYRDQREIDRERLARALLKNQIENAKWEDPVLVVDLKDPEVLERQQREQEIAEAKSAPLSSQRDEPSARQQFAAHDKVIAFEEPGTVDASVLETFPYEYAGIERGQVLIKNVTQEFTSVCPFSGLPDFATITISYEPGSKCIELRSLKYYLMGYRNVGIWYEHLVNKLLHDLVDSVEPKSMVIELDVASRGGIVSQLTATYDREADEVDRVIDSLDEAMDRPVGPGADALAQVKKNLQTALDAINQAKKRAIEVVKPRVDLAKGQSHTVKQPMRRVPGLFAGDKETWEPAGDPIYSKTLVPPGKHEPPRGVPPPPPDDGVTIEVCVQCGGLLPPVHETIYVRGDDGRRACCSQTCYADWKAAESGGEATDEECQAESERALEGHPTPLSEFAGGERDSSRDEAQTGEGPYQPPEGTVPDNRCEICGAGPPLTSPGFGKWYCESHREQGVRDARGATRLHNSSGVAPGALVHGAAMEKQHRMTQEEFKEKHGMYTHEIGAQPSAELIADADRTFPRPPAVPN